VRSNRSRRSEHEHRGEGIHRPAVARLGSTAVHHGPHRSSSARGYEAQEMMGAGANQRGDRNGFT
jgi:hypothetical protein